MNRKVADLRRPLPGNEVEAATVTAEIGRLVEVVCADRDSVLEGATNPRFPGVFSDALHERLCKLERDARTAAALMRRLRALCGDTRPERVADLEREAAGGWSIVELIEDATPEEFRAASEAVAGVRRQRRDRAATVDGCPHCGGATTGCTPEGRTILRHASRPAHEAPARTCDDCGAIIPAGAARNARTEPGAANGHSTRARDLGPDVIDLQARRGR